MPQSAKKMFVLGLMACAAAMLVSTSDAAAAQQQQAESGPPNEPFSGQPFHGRTSIMLPIPERVSSDSGFEPATGASPSRFEDTL